MGYSPWGHKELDMTRQLKYISNIYIFLFLAVLLVTRIYVTPLKLSVLPVNAAADTHQQWR